MNQSLNAISALTLSQSLSKSTFPICEKSLSFWSFVSSLFQPFIVKGKNKNVLLEAGQPQHRDILVSTSFLGTNARAKTITESFFKTCRDKVSL